MQQNSNKITVCTLVAIKSTYLNKQQGRN